MYSTISARKLQLLAAMVYCSASVLMQLLENQSGYVIKCGMYALVLIADGVQICCKYISKVNLLTLRLCNCPKGHNFSWPSAHFSLFLWKLYFFSDTFIYIAFMWCIYCCSKAKHRNCMCYQNWVMTNGVSFKLCFISWWNILVQLCLVLNKTL